MTTSLEAYLAQTWRPDGDYVEGEVRERNWGEFEHADLQSAINTWLRTRRCGWNVRVVVEQQVRVSPTRCRVVDITVLSADRKIEPVITHPPVICIEVQSEQDTFVDMWERLLDYSTMGVPNIWLFEPERREVWVWTANAMTKVTGGVLTASGTEIAIPLEEIWSDLD